MKKTFATHDHVESAIRYLLRLIANATPAEQPSDAVLDALLRLLEHHKSGTPAQGVEERLQALNAKLQSLETRSAFAEAVKQARAGQR